MDTCLWQLGFTQLCHKVSKNDFKVTEELFHFLNSGEVLTRICFRAELDFILIGKQHSDLSSNFLNSGGGQVFLQHHIFHISLVHVRTTKKGEKLNKCNHCDFSSSRAANLRTHLKTHSGEKPPKCNQCDYASSQSGDLRTHLKTHNGEKSNKWN